MSRIFASKCVPKYQKNHQDLKWFERDFMTYIDHLKYQECVINLDSYFDMTKVVNFDKINNRCRGDCLIKPIKEHQTICKNDFIIFQQKIRIKLFRLP